MTDRTERAAAKTIAVPAVTLRPSRLWRAVAPDGSTWSEASDEHDVRSRARPGDIVQQQWTGTVSRWLPAESPHMNRIEHTDLVDEEEMNLLGMADAYEQIRATYGPALEVMRQVASRPDMPLADRPTITIQRTGGVDVQLDEGHDPGWARVLAAILEVDLDTEPSWVPGDGSVREWETDTRPRRALMLTVDHGDIA